jgi:hypothetical protein
MRFLAHLYGHFSVPPRSTRGHAPDYITTMKELLRSSDPTIIAFACALLQGEDIDCFQMDVNMSILEGGIGIFPRRLMVHPDNLDAATLVMRDNDIPLGL